ncbi:serine/threonine-protein kinase bud32 [Monascus purpureus]|uniref:EKC/KEOPS complex subunit BUD32 n=1 Tax=Monascus purpureus TaxID=5098 RepID=A0A507QYY2_MONPU|nr:serine/threonine-protein kinase bud32 [Monascus purpureus]BDD57148.1 serine/threonine-protein kinase bud32 [Monascus purpureus]
MTSTTHPETYTPPPLPSPFTNTTPPPTLLAQGAEARLYKTVFLTPSTPAALKVRPSKPYRHPILDRRLTRQRILQEARCLAKLTREGVSVPAVLALDWEGQGGESGIGGAWLLMEWIEGLVLRVVLERWEGWMKRNLDADATVRLQEEARARDLLRRIGRVVGRLHKAGVVHGDLTTSNLVLRPPSAGEDAREDDGNPSMEGEVVLIDFGLASQSVQDEDQAVDLYVLERAIGSTHPRTEAFFDEVLQGYRESYKGANAVLRRLEDVRMRGRKRSMVG